MSTRQRKLTKDEIGQAFAWLGHRSDRSMASVYYRLSDEDSQHFMLKVPLGTGEPAADAGST